MDDAIVLPILHVFLDQGEHQEALQMARDLEALDDDIDAIEGEIRLWKSGTRGRGKKEHFL